MAEVSVRINGYVYTVGCEDGQESHLQAMAAEVDARIASIRAVGGQSGEARLLLLAALLLADELHDVKLAPAPPADDAGARTFSAELERLAEKAEAIADDLEQA